MPSTLAEPVRAQCWCRHSFAGWPSLGGGTPIVYQSGEDGADRALEETLVWLAVDHAS